MTGPTEGKSALGAREGWALAALVLAAMAYRALRWALTPVLFNDGPVFIDLAQRLAAGEWLVALDHGYHPLYSAAIALSHQAIADWETAAVAVSVAAGGASVWIAHGWVRAMFGATPAWVAAIAVAVHPFASAYGADVQSDGFYLALFLGGLWALWRTLETPTLGRAIATGLLIGVGYLARPEGGGIAIGGLVLLGWGVARGDWDSARAVRIGAGLVVGAAIVTAPYIGVLSARTGGLTISQKKSINRLVGAEAFSNWIRRGDSDAFFRQKQASDPLLVAHPELEPPPPGVRPFRDAPRALGWRRYPRSLAMFSDAAISVARYELAVLVLLGMWTARGRLTARGRFLCVFAALYFAVLFLLGAHVGYLSRRHVLPWVMLGLGYAGLGAPVLGHALGRLARSFSGRPARLTTRAATLTAMAVVIALGIGKGLRPHREGAVAARDAAVWLGANHAPEAGVATLKQRVAYYAEAPYVNLRKTPHPALLFEFLEDRGAAWVIVDGDQRAELLRLAAADPARLELVQTFEANGSEAHVYRIVPASSDDTRR